MEELAQKLLGLDVISVDMTVTEVAHQQGFRSEAPELARYFGQTPGRIECASSSQPFHEISFGIEDVAKTGPSRPDVIVLKTILSGECHQNKAIDVLNTKKHPSKR